MQLPAVVTKELEDRQRARWSGTITLNYKEGQVVAYEVTDKHRIHGEDPR